MPDDLKIIASGGQPVWTGVYKHPQHGELTFTAKLPRARDLMRHTVETDNQVEDVYGGISNGTALFAAALSGLKVLIDCPVIGETREEPEGDDSHVIVKKLYYNPEDEFDETFVTQVWLDFSQWRRSLLEGVVELGNSSGETSGNGSSESSSEPTVSPSTILA